MMTAQSTVFGQTERTQFATNQAWEMWSWRTTLVVTALSMVLAGVACGPGDVDVIDSDGTQSFSIEQFGENIKSQVDPLATGWAYVIYYNGKAEKWEAGGQRRTSADPPQMDMTIYDPFNVGSVSKTLTAMGMMLALQEAGELVDSQISPWLPADWIRGDYVDLITFRDLLTHESGIRVDADYYDDIKVVIEDGINAGADYGIYDYSNTNFTLMRVLIPYLTGYTPGNDNESGATARVYRQWMIKHVFEPAGLSNVEPWAPAFNPTLYYSYPDLGLPGIDSAKPGNGELEITGAGTWHLSALQLASLMWTFMNTEKIMSASQRSEMLDGELGIYADSLTGGAAYNHNGGLNFEGSPYSGQMPAGARAVFYIMPNDVVASLVYNSMDYPGKMLDWSNGVVRGAYDNAWSP